MPQTRSTCAGAQVEVPAIVVYLEQSGHRWKTRSCWSWWSWSCGSCCRASNFPGDDIPIVRGMLAGVGVKSTDPNAPEYASIWELLPGGGRVHPDAEARDGQAVPDANRGCVLDQGRGTVGDRRVERGVVKATKRWRSWAGAKTRKSVVTGVEMFRKLLDQGQAGDNIGCLLRGIDREDVERGMVLAKTGSITPHHDV